MKNKDVVNEIKQVLEKEEDIYAAELNGQSGRSEDFEQGFRACLKYVRQSVLPLIEDSLEEDDADEIGQLAETLDNALFGYQTMKQLPAHIHLEGLTGAMREVRDDLVKLYKESGGIEELNIQA